jgi:hypothetical protein
MTRKKRRVLYASPTACCVNFPDLSVIGSGQRLEG